MNGLGFSCGSAREKNIIGYILLIQPIASPVLLIRQMPRSEKKPNENLQDLFKFRNNLLCFLK